MFERPARERVLVEADEKVADHPRDRAGRRVEKHDELLAGAGEEPADGRLAADARDAVVEGGRAHAYSLKPARGTPSVLDAVLQVGDPRCLDDPDELEGLLAAALEEPCAASEQYRDDVDL